ncbi:hypothetical protein DDZ14_08440 [Maritimibacter sp. 55A14]|uniref:hypothetical protein n=1 Tax=Maritimibacter sp. 55A14 TaxID=2174844 RepID=UPI000D60C073|nr:hypothetical protein [Maritimibacter sp. 55A14]PWE32765.1 hypothetical protein DDZ14_08440 [Maritimibacter sp. 55A14]
MSRVRLHFEALSHGMVRMYVVDAQERTLGAFEYLPHPDWDETFARDAFACAAQACAEGVQVTANWPVEGDRAQAFLTVRIRKVLDQRPEVAA